MNKTELINKVAIETGFTKKDVEEIVNKTFETITDALAEEEKVKIFGFGNFEVRERAARKGYSPALLKKLKEQGVPEEEAKKQAEVDIDASKTVGFKPAKSLKGAVQ